MIYNPHPLASIFPLMAASEYVALKEDIKTHGLREPIWILDGQILDGRNRFKACQEVGVTPRVQEYHGDDPLALVISLNLQRRHLSESQRAMVAAKLANMPRGGDGSNQHGSKSANLQISATPVDAGFEVANAGVANLHLRIPGISQVEAASLLNVSPRSVATAKKVEEQAEPELVEAVASGQVSVSAAAVITELPPETQHYAAANPQEAPAIAANHRALGTGENEWYTPEKYLQAVRAVLGGIDLDPASCPLANETVKAARIFTLADDGLKQPWAGKVFVNPPYSQPAMANFAEKLAREWQAGNLEAAIALTHNYTDTAWFQRLARACSAICFTRGRIGFINPEGKKAAPTQGQAFFYFGDDSGWFATHFDPIGFIVEVRDGLS